MQLQKYFILPIFCLLGFTIVIQAQTGFKYQAVIRDAEGTAMKEVTTDVRIYIHADDGELIYAEIHSDEMTSEFGILGLEVGTGILEEGVDTDFAEIDWGATSYALSVDLSMSEVDNGAWVRYGTSPILTVPVAMFAHSVRDKDDADADPENEIQNLSLVDNVLSISGGNTVTLGSTQGRDEQILSLEDTNLSISGGNTINLAPIIDGGGDQQLAISGDQLTISGDDGNTITLPIGSEPQNLSLVDNVLSISDGNSVTLSGGGGNPTDEIQELQLNGSNLELVAADGTVNGSVPYNTGTADADPSNELQTLSFDASTNELSLTDGNTVTIPTGGTDADADPTNEIQTISFDAVTNELSLSDGGIVIIPTGGTDADADPSNEFQNLSFDATTNELSLTDGNTVTIPTGGTDADADPTNEIQNLSFDATTNELSLTDGNTVTIPTGGTDADADPTNEIQDISLNTTTNELTITGGSTITLPASGGVPQDLIFNDTDFEIGLTGSSTTIDLKTLPDAVDDADADPSNEFQSLSFNATTSELSLTDGNTVTIPSGGTDADADPTNELQDISLNSTTNELTITGGSTITLPASGGVPQDLIFNDTDFEIGLTGSTTTIDLKTLPDAVDDADADPSNEFQSLSFDATTSELSLTDGNTVTIPTGGTDADADPMNELQELVLNDTDDMIGITDGNFIDLSSYKQDISFDAGTNELSISAGNTIVIPTGAADADADPMNELQELVFNDTDDMIGITDGNSIDLSVFKQELVLNDTDDMIGITDGNSIDLSSYKQDISYDVGTNELSISGGSSVILPSGGADADADPMNEIQDLVFNNIDNQIELTGSTSTIDLSNFKSPWTEIYKLSLPAQLLELSALDTQIGGEGGISVSNLDGEKAALFEGGQIGAHGLVNKIDVSDTRLTGLRGEVLGFVNDNDLELIGVSGIVQTSATGNAIGLSGFARDGNKGYGVNASAIESQHAIGGKFYANGRVESIGLEVSTDGASNIMKGIVVDIEGNDFASGSEYTVSARDVIGRAGTYKGAGTDDSPERSFVIGSENSISGLGRLVGYQSFINGATDEASFDELLGFNTEIRGFEMIPASRAIGAKMLVETIGGSANGVDMTLRGDGVNGVSISGDSKNNYAARGVSLFLNGSGANVSGINSNVGSNLDADIATAGSFKAFDAGTASYGIIAQGQSIASQSIIRGDIDERSRPLTVSSSILGGNTFQAASYHSSSGSSSAVYDFGVLSINSTDGQSPDGELSVGVAGFAEAPLNSNYGVWGEADGASGYFNVGVFGSSGAGSNDYAGYFTGKVRVAGNLEKAGGTFKIDHPQDPENKYLVHSFVESPDMMNIYNGNTTTDATGNSIVELPDYFEALNMEFRYQLTVIGQFAQAIVIKKIEGNKFEIATDKPNVEVSWQVTGVRNDPWAQKNRVVDVVDKKEDRGTYLMPELYGQPKSKSYLEMYRQDAKNFKSKNSISLEESLEEIRKQQKNKK